MRGSCITVNALQHVRREGRCEEVREDMVPQHHPAYRAPPDTSQHHPTPPGLPMVSASRTSSHPPSRRTCCRALYSFLASDHRSPELYSLYSVYSVVYYTAIQLIHYTALYNHPLGETGLGFPRYGIVCAYNRTLNSNP